MIKLRYSVDSCLDALVRISKSRANHEEEAGEILKKGKQIVKFLSYEYSEVHLKLEDTKNAHC